MLWNRWDHSARETDTSTSRCAILMLAWSEIPKCPHASTRSAGGRQSRWTAPAHRRSLVGRRAIRIQAVCLRPQILCSSQEDAAPCRAGRSRPSPSRSCTTALPSIFACGRVLPAFAPAACVRAQDARLRKVEIGAGEHTYGGVADRSNRMMRGWAKGAADEVGWIDYADDLLSPVSCRADEFKHPCHHIGHEKGFITLPDQGFTGFQAPASAQLAQCFDFGVIECSANRMRPDGAITATICEVFNSLMFGRHPHNSAPPLTVLGVTIMSIAMSWR